MVLRATFPRHAGLQWWIYDTFKTIMGMGTTGGGNAPKLIK